MSRPDNFKDVCAAIDAKLRCLESNVGKCLNDQGKQNIRSISLSFHGQLCLTDETFTMSEVHRVYLTPPGLRGHRKTEKNQVLNPCKPRLYGLKGSQLVLLFQRGLIINILRKILGQE